MKKKPLQERFFAQFPNTAGIVVLRDGKVVWEEYGNACSASSRLHLYSSKQYPRRSILFPALSYRVIHL